MKRAILFLFVIFLSTALFAQNVETGGKESLKITGFLSSTFFAQNQQFAFSNGQSAEFPTTNYTQHQWFYGGDIRNTRLTMVFGGPELTNDWKLGGVLEFDAFNDPSNTGAFGGQIWTPRVRLAYVDVSNSNLTVRIGQAWDPLFGNVAVSLSHIAFPLGYGTAGDVGWRFPGIFLYYKFDSNSATHVSLDLAVMANSWNAFLAGQATTSFNTAGNSGTPQFEAKLNLENKFESGGVLKVYVAGHFDQKNLAGAGADSTNNLTGTAGELGASFSSHGLLLQGNVYTGKNVGQQFGNLTQFPDVNLDLASTGGWAQIGYAFESGWGIYGFYGLESVNQDDAVALRASREKNSMYDIMLRYETGPYALGLEFLQDKLTSLAYSGNTFTEPTQTGTQIALSAMYHF
jgi:hypothetical protein